LARDVLGYFYDKARASTLWFLGDHVDDSQWEATHTLNNWRQSRDMSEIVVILLASNAQQSDYFETLLPTIVRSWAGRQTGLVSNTRMNDRVARARATVQAERFKWDTPILGMVNPAGLSRAEFRVCLLLSRGLSVKGVTDELGLTEATVRTHLRSIYAKTETSSLAELLYRILSSGTEEAEVPAVSTRRA
jgi:DNA-binding NarL/FixJ family response regulator